MSVLVVRSAKEYVISKGVPQTTNEFPWLTTNLVAWLTNGKLIGKSAAQNHWEYKGQRYAIDAIAYPIEGIEVDCLVNAGPPDNGNVPAWSVSTLKPAPYLPPIDPATIWPTNPPPPSADPPTNPGTPPVDLAPLLERLDRLEAAVIALVSAHSALAGDIKTLASKPHPNLIGRLGLNITLRPEQDGVLPR